MLLLSYYCGLIAEIQAVPNGSLITKKSINKAFAVLSFFVVTFVAAFRNNFVDTGVYKAQYIKINNWEYFINYKDKGFAVLMWVLNLMSSHPQTLIIITAVIINILIFRTLYKYCVQFEMGIFLFITTGCFALSMNGIRQFLAASVIFAATYLILNAKFKQYFLVVLLAASLHSSALIMIPVYFIVRRKAWSWSTFLIIVISIAGYLGFNTLLPLVSGALGESRFESNLNYFNQGNGVNIIRILVQAVPVILAYIVRDRLKVYWDKSDIIVNFSMLNLIVMIFASYSWIIARICFYFQIYNILLIPWIIHSGFDKKARRFLYYLCFVLFTFYFYYEMVYMFKNDFQLIFRLS